MQTVNDADNQGELVSILTQAFLRYAVTAVIFFRASHHPLRNA